MKKYICSMVLMFCLLALFAPALEFGANPGFSLLTSGTTTISGGVDKGNCYDNNGSLDCDEVGGPNLLGTSGWVYAGSISFPGSFVSATAVMASNNQVRVQEFFLPFAIRVSHLHVRVGTGNALAVCGVGLYNAAGSLVIETGAVDCSTSTTNRSVTVSATTIPAGPYYVAWTVSDTTAVLIGSSNAGSVFEGLLNVNYTRVGACANTSTAGALPATCGAITGDTAITVYAGLILEP